MPVTPADSNVDSNADSLAGIAARAARLAPKDPQIRAFPALLYGRIMAEDLKRYEPGELAAAAVGAWRLLRRRTPGTPLIRISNPAITARSEYGLPAPLTVIDIVNDNMPFLVDSVMGELTDRGLAVHLFAHPLLAVARTPKGRLKSLRGSVQAGDGERRESVMQIHVARIDDAEGRADLEAALRDVLQEVSRAVSDWRPMLDRLTSAIRRFKATPPPLPVDELAEGIQFLNWLADRNFTFLGMREYTFGPDGGMRAIARSGLGILRDPGLKVLRRGHHTVSITPELRDFLLQPVPLIVTKANMRSRVHRRVHMDYVGIKLYTPEGALSGELRVVGLFTSTAYTRSARSIPYLRRKLDHVLQATGLDPDSHSGKALIHVLEQFPRDELFQIDPETLTRFATTIMHLDEHPRLRVLSRIDRFDRFVSVLAYVPRDRLNTDAAAAIGRYLAQAYDGRVSAYYPALTDGPLVRVHYIIGRFEGDTPQIGQAELEAAIGAIIKSWGDNLRAALAAAFPDDFAALSARYGDAFTAAYQEAFDAQAALGDIAVMEGLDGGGIAIAFQMPDGDGEGPSRLALRILHLGAAIPLSSRVPLLENMGFKVISERSYRIRPQGTDRVWLHDMTLQQADGLAVDTDALAPLLADCFTAVWSGEAENDGYNGLVLRAGLVWRDVAVLRAYGRYARQITLPFSQDYLWETLNRHPAIAADLIALFKARFDPALKGGERARKRATDAAMARIEEALAGVDSLDEDRIVRAFVNMMGATLRTNLFQAGAQGPQPPALAFKIAPRAVDGMPRPRPLAEIFVYSPRLEGVHMRFGKVARGGLRWSDRPQDFRTEVLGLVKAQQVKNAVIVPGGAKGGFVPKRLPDPSDRDAFMAEGVACYEIFIASLLDVTDNIEGDATVPPPKTVRMDGDDPYLVVAADKGTATFSDIANGISTARGFWLDDAFASGGSAGYDHKKMGITARGAWEAVKRHFRELDIDIQTTPFTVVGIGDMSGDVFGNGMLRSPQIRLLAAFDHRDIFIDPDPDPEASFAERKRLFKLPRSSWQDYDPALISRGGGVFSRHDKAIPLSDEMQALSGLRKAAASPPELINALLKARVDLLWFGGIGTYVRASDESDEQVGDRANDAIRVAAAELNATVVGEGANLGMTQRARIEFALAGGRINTDAIDNSAGVNSSDLEVNIKIALGPVVRAGKLTMAERNRLLARMTGDVAALVLRNNYQQTLALSLVERAAMEDFGFQLRFMRDLEQQGLLDRAVEHLPDEAAMEERGKAGRPLTRPELAVLLAYAKITLCDQLLESAVPDDDYLGRELMRYFPAELAKRYPQAIAGHRLRREIIATMLANSMINRGGPSFVSRLAGQTGADVATIAAAYAVVRDSFSLSAMNAGIDALDNRVSGDVQLDLYGRLRDLLHGQVYRFVRNVRLDGGLAAVVERTQAGVEALLKGLPAILPEDARQALGRTTEAIRAHGLPAPLARRMAALPYLASTPDIVLVADETGRDVAETARVFFAAGAWFATERLHEAARALVIAGYFDRLALERTLESLDDSRRRITALALAAGRPGEDALTAWAAAQGGDLERTRRTLAEIAADDELSLSKLMVAASLLRDLTHNR